MVNPPRVSAGELQVLDSFFFHKTQVIAMVIHQMLGLSSRLQRFLPNFLHFPSQLSLYPLLSVELEWYFRLVLYIYIYI